MPALENHTGLLKQTIPFENRRSFVNISNTKQYYSAYPALVRNMKKAIANNWVKFQFGLPTEVFDGGGTEFKFNVQVTSNNTGEWVDEDDPVNIEKKDFQIKGTLPWRLARVMKWSYSDWELSACKGKEEIVNLMVSRALGNEQGAVDWMENWFWGTPPASTDTKTAFPLRYYVYTEPESTAGSYSSAFNAIQTGVNGNRMNLNHNNFTSGPAGISRATYPRSGNWNCQYTAFTTADFVTKFAHACMDTHWFAPVDFPNLVKEGPDMAVYTTKTNIITKGELQRAQNDQNGSDLLTRQTDADLYRIPFFWVPQFEDTTNFSLYSSSNKDVAYGINWNSFYWASKTGFRMEDKLFGPSLEAPLHHTHVRYLGGQLVCLDASSNFVLSK